MSHSKKSIPFEPGMVIRDCLFFISFFLYIGLRIEPHLIFHGGWNTPNFPVFYRDGSFFWEFLSYPGGLVEYGSAFLSQLLYYSWSGALIITAQAWLIFACTNSIIKSLHSPQLEWLRFAPPIVFLVLYSQYVFYFTTMMALAVALVFVCFYMKIHFKNKALDLIVLGSLSVILYALAGGAVMVFALLCAMHEWLSKRRWETALGGLAFGFLVPYIAGVHMYGMSVSHAFTRLTPISWDIPLYNKKGLAFVYSLYLFLPGIALACIIGRRWVHGFIPPKFMRKISKISILKNKKPRWILDSCVLFMVTGAAICFSYDHKQKTILAVDYFACHRMWPQVLEAAKAYPQHDLVMAAVNRALYHTGQLGNTERVLHQKPNTFLLTDEKYKQLYWFQFDIYLDLCYVNKAEHQLAEALDYYGERPQLLQRMALINMVKGNLGTARIYLGALRKMLFYSKWANVYLDQIASDPAMSMNTQVQHIRSMMMRRDAVASQRTDVLLLELLEKNRYNRMAFEYLMTLSLLMNDLDVFVRNLDRLKDFNDPQIPPLYEEAILLCNSNPNLRSAIQGKDLKISIQSIQRFKDFIRAFSVFQENREVAFREFPENLRNNYFFYYVFYDNLHPRNAP